MQEGTNMPEQPHTEKNIDHVEGQQDTGNHKKPGSPEAHGADKFGGSRAGSENVEPASKP